MHLQLDIDLVPHLTAEEVSAFEAKCKQRAESPECVVANLIRQEISETSEGNACDICHGQEVAL